MESSSDLRKFSHVLTDRNIEGLLKEVENSTSNASNQSHLLLQRDILLRASKANKKIYHMNSKETPTFEK